MPLHLHHLNCFDILNKAISSQARVSHPFSVAVFKDSMYWDDWKQNAIFMADKDHGVAIQKITESMLGLMELKVNYSF